MNGIGQLVKGILIGFVLLLAVIGLLKISGKSENPDLPTPVQSNNIPAPSISVSNPSSTASTTTDSTASTTTPLALDNNDKESLTENSINKTENTGNDIEKVTATVATNNAQNTFKPEILEEPIRYGTLNLTAKQKVEFLIFDKNNKRVAASKDNHKASFHLPTGQYKVITLLDNQKETQTVEILENKTNNTSVSIQAPITTGVLKVAAVSAKSNQSIKTTFSIQDANGELVGKRQDVPSTLFKLDAGTYKITATYDGISETRTVNVEAGTSQQEIFSLKKSVLPAEILVRAIEEGTNQAVEVDLIITTKNGQKIKELTSISNTKINLKAGEYRINVNAPNGQSTRNITLKEGDYLAETFRFKRKQVEVTEPVIVNQEPVTPSTTTAPIVTTDNNNTQQNIPASSVEPTISEVTKPDNIKGTLKLSAISSNTKKPVKSNFYVQTTNGKHIAKKIYSDSANFELDKGIYKITIKSKNMKTITKTITVDSNSKLNRMFSMHGIMATPSTTSPEIITNNPANTPVRANNIPQTSNATKPATRLASGSLVFNVRHNSRNRPRTPFLSDFLIKTKSGKTIANITKVQNATVKLDVGEYVITANHRGRRKSRHFKITQNQATRVSFNSTDFNSLQPQAPVRLPKGVLKSRVINNQGQPLKGNFSVTNQRGKVVHRVNNVSHAQFNLPATSYTVHINYQGLKGSEQIKIIAGETTVQTFTIADAPAPQTRQPNSRNTQRNKTMSGRELRHAIEDKVKEELKRITR